MVSDQKSFNQQVSRFGFYTAIVFIVSSIASLFLPLDISGGSSAELAARVDWLNNNRGIFILGWINQMIAMFSLSGLLLSLCWVGAKSHPLSGLLAALFMVFATMAFVIPKFIAIWTIPLLADAIANGSVNQTMAAQLLLLLNVSVPFSLYTSFDYLGFWLYALGSLIIAIPLIGISRSLNIAAVSTGIFGLGFHILFALLIFGAISAAELEAWFLSVASVLMITAIAALIRFKAT